jgi:dienelactone hydrolase
MTAAWRIALALIAALALSQAGRAQELAAALREEIIMVDKPGLLAPTLRATQVPSLWFYGDNDSYWTVPVWHEMLRQYTEAGGKARVVAYGPFGSDAHGMFGARAGVAIWLPEVEKFLRELGLPFDKAEP